jgi:hypothetical protein
MYRMVERQQDDGGADSERTRAGGDGRGDDERRRQEVVLILVMLAEEAGVEADGLGELRFGADLVDGALEMFAAPRVGDGRLEAEFHVLTSRLYPVQ